VWSARLQPSAAITANPVRSAKASRSIELKNAIAGQRDRTARQPSVVETCVIGLVAHFEAFAKVPAPYRSFVAIRRLMSLPPQHAPAVSIVSDPESAPTRAKPEVARSDFFAPSSACVIRDPV
jgi:hypothetical protein